jgi:hypothetical protein
VLSLLSFLLTLTSLPPASVDVYPHLGMAPLTVRVRTTIERDVRNRSACLFYVSVEGNEGQSCWELAGDQAARTTTRYEILEGGDYEFGIIVYQEGRSSMYAQRQTVQVIGR